VTDAEIESGSAPGPRRAGWEGEVQRDEQGLRPRGGREDARQEHEIATGAHSQEPPKALNTEDLAVWAECLAQGLDEAPRLGHAEDYPEGSRWIVVSDALACEISLRLRQVIRRLKAG